jgi:signal transduction histidine kinase
VPRVHTLQLLRWCQHHLSRQVLNLAGCAVYNLAMSSPDRPVPGRRQAGVYRVIVSLYLAGLVLWLVIGVVPPLAEAWPPVRQGLLDLAVHGGPLSAYAGRMASGSLGSDSVGVVALAYLFSGLNLALGVLLMIKRPRDLVPRLLALAFMGTAATFNDPSHEVFHVLGEPPLVKAIHFTFHVVSGVAYLWAVVLFPNGDAPVGRSLTSRGRQLVAVCVTAALAVLCWRSSFIYHPKFFVAFFGVLVPLVGMSAQTLHLRLLRDATDDEQSRLLRVALLPALSAAVVWLVAEGAAVLGLASGVGRQVAAGVQNVFPAVFAVVPVMMFIAIVRHRLWDIDVLASRALLLALLLAFVAVVYVGCIGATGWLLRGTGIAVLVPLIVIACVAEPVLEWCQRLCNRLVFGTRMSPREAVRSLVERFSGAGDVDELTELTRVVVQSTRASAATIWLRRGSDLLPLAQHPTPAGPTVRLRLAAATPEAGEAALAPADCWPVTYEGDLLGMVAVTTPKGVALTTKESRLLDDLSRHAGLLVANAQLTVDLARQLDIVARRARELQTSREQVVRAQDVQRRRLESDIHDGAQQQLVALLIQLGVLQRSGRTGAATEASVAQLKAVLSATQETLARLAVGGAPPVLIESGLHAALEDAAAGARQVGVSVEVRYDAPAPVGVDAQAAIYFCCLEALQNIVKHAEADEVVISVRSDAESFRFSVTDNGVGFLADRVPRGSGLGNLAERLTALGGEVELTSAPGHGTTVRGSLPSDSTATVAASGSLVAAGAR